MLKLDHVSNALQRRRSTGGAASAGLRPLAKSAPLLHLVDVAHVRSQPDASVVFLCAWIRCCAPASLRVLRMPQLRTRCAHEAVLHLLASAEGATIGRFVMQNADAYWDAASEDEDENDVGDAEHVALESKTATKRFLQRAQQLSDQNRAHTATERHARAAASRPEMRYDDRAYVVDAAAAPTRGMQVEMLWRETRNIRADAGLPPARLDPLYSRNG